MYQRLKMNEKIKKHKQTPVYLVEKFFDKEKAIIFKNTFAWMASSFIENYTGAIWDEVSICNEQAFYLKIQAKKNQKFTFTNQAIKLKNLNAIFVSLAITTCALSAMIEQAHQQEIILSDKEYQNIKHLAYLIINYACDETKHNVAFVDNFISFITALSTFKSDS